MSTTTETTAARPARKVKRFIVTFNGVECRRVSDRRFGTKLIPGSGYRTKSPGSPEVFKGVKSAERAIRFTERMRKKLGDAVFELPESHRDVMERGAFNVSRWNPPAE